MNSKFLSLLLRHDPKKLNLHMDENGWVSVKELIDNNNQKNNETFNLDELKEIVNKNNKKRFEFKNGEFDFIRARQGHSLKDIDVELDVIKHDELTFYYHGTTLDRLDSIKEYGLKKMKRNHVHLSADLNTAILVAKRHSNDICVLALPYEQGSTILKSRNNVFLSNDIQPEKLWVLIMNDGLYDVKSGDKLVHHNPNETLINQLMKLWNSTK